MLPTPSLSVGNAAAIAAVAGLLISWALFVWWGSVNGLDPATFWVTALTANEPGTGLTWDLVFSGVITSILAISQRQVIGTKGLGLAIGLTWTLGVCVGLGSLVWMLSRRGSSQS